MLEELVRKGFSNTANDIPPLLTALRTHGLWPKKAELVEFLCTMEEMIGGMLATAPTERASLENLLQMLDYYEAKRPLITEQSFIDLCVTRRRATKVIEVDVSKVSTDAELFGLIRKTLLPSSSFLDRVNLPWRPSNLGVTDLRFIKFAMSDGVFGVLDGPNSVPPASLLNAKEYSFKPIAATEIPIPRDIFILPSIMPKPTRKPLASTHS